MTLDDDVDYVQPVSQVRPSAGFLSTPGKVGPGPFGGSSSLFGAATSAEPQFEAAMLIGATPGRSIAGTPFHAPTPGGTPYPQLTSDPANTPSHWVTVFGYPSGSEDAVRSYFASIAAGDILDVKYTPQGHMHIWYVQAPFCCSPDFFVPTTFWFAQFSACQ